MNGSLRVLLVFLNAELASSRIRIVQMAPWLERCGLHVELQPYPSGRANWNELRRRAADSDIVVLQKKLPGWLDGNRWRSLGKPIVFDFDDALPFRQQPENGAWTSATRRKRFARALARSRGVLAGNRYLAELCGEHPSVCILPSPVPFPVPTRAERDPGDVPVVGWIGGRGNLASLASIGDALRTAAGEAPFRLHVVSDGALTIDGVDSIHIPWSLDTQDDEVARFDIGLMPLEDTPWNRGKCAYKALQYMAAGVATIASPVGMNTELIEPGRNGLLAADSVEWERAVVALSTDAGTRARMAEAGREDVQREYTYAALAERMADYLRRVFEGESTRKR